MLVWIWITTRLIVRTPSSRPIRTRQNGLMGSASTEAPSNNCLYSYPYPFPRNKSNLAKYIKTSRGEDKIEEM